MSRPTLSSSFPFAAAPSASSRFSSGPSVGPSAAANRRAPVAPPGQNYDALALGLAQKLALLSAARRAEIATLRRPGTAGPVGQVLLVSSARPREGKSFIVGKLARRLTWVVGEPVAVIDGNPSHPSVGSIFKARAEGRGLFACIARGRLLPEQFQASCVRDVFVMPARDEGRASLLTRVSQVSRVLDDCRRRYALTIIDAGALAETGCLSQLVDGSVLVVDASRTRRDAVQGALAMPQIDRSRMLGVVLNRQPRDIPEWLYRRFM